jgi:hypothetical protein
MNLRTSPGPADPAPGAGAAGAAPAAKPSFRDRLFTMTPVVLTVLATLLAGLSNSEMTQAQYHRSLAAQSQSKAGDAWSFFQARRTRAAVLEAAVALAPALSRTDPPEPAALLAESDLLVQALRRGERAAKQAGPAGEKLAATAADAAGKAERARDQLRALLGKAEVAEAFTGAAWGPAAGARAEPNGRAPVRDVLAAVEAGASEEELAPLLRRLPPADLYAELQAAQAEANRLDGAGAAVTKRLEAVSGAVAAQVAQARAFHRAAAGVLAVLAERAGADRPEGQRPAEAELARADAAVKSAAEELALDLKTAELDATARRHRAEARANQRIAGLNEVQVRQEGVRAEHHRHRSRQFFYGMLLAQLGVTVASLALAVQRRSGLWALAGLAGLAALVFGAYVYLYD